MRKGYFFLLGLVALLLSACGAPKTPDKDIVILFENDVHCALDGYAKFSALKHEMQGQTPYVAVVSSGDFVNELGKNAAKSMAFFGQEKVEFNAKLCIMNMAVHGLNAKIVSAAM